MTNLCPQLVRRALYGVLVALLAAALPARPQTSPPDPALSYRFKTQDTLLFAVREDPMPGASTSPLRVNALGEVHFPISRGFDEYITLKVAGKTLPEVVFELRALLNADYYQDCSVDLKLLEQDRRAGEVLFFGAVRSNVLTLPPGETKTIFEGAYQVGLNEFANLKKVKIYRVDPTTGERTARTVNLEDIKQGDRTQDIPLRNGDRVEIPEKRIVF